MFAVFALYFSIKSRKKSKKYVLSCVSLMINWVYDWSVIFFLHLSMVQFNSISAYLLSYAASQRDAIIIRWIGIGLTSYIYELQYISFWGKIEQKSKAYSGLCQISMTEIIFGRLLFPVLAKTLHRWYLIQSLIQVVVQVAVEGCFETNCSGIVGKIK